MKTLPEIKKYTYVLLILIIPMLNCDVGKNSLEYLNLDTSEIVLRKSIEGIMIGDDSLTVIRKLGNPAGVGFGDFDGYIFEYREGHLKYTRITISNKIGVTAVTVEKPYSGRSKEGIGINSERDFVISKIGLPDLTTSNSNSIEIDDIYFYERNRFYFNYLNLQIHRITMGTPKK